MNSKHLKPSPHLVELREVVERHARDQGRRRVVAAREGSSRVRAIDGKRITLIFGART